MKKRKFVRKFSCTGPVVTEEMFEDLPEYETVQGVPFSDLVIPMRLVYGKSEWFIVARFEERNVFGFVVLEGNEYTSAWGVITIDSLAGFSGVAHGNMVMAGGPIQIRWREELKTRNADIGCRVDPLWKPQKVVEVERIFQYSKHSPQFLGHVSSFYF